MKANARGLRPVVTAIVPGGATLSLRIVRACDGAPLECRSDRRPPYRSSKLHALGDEKGRT